MATTDDAARVVRRYEEDGSVFVVYEVRGCTLRARLDSERDGAVYTLRSLVEVADAGRSAPVFGHHSITHVPPVVREELDRPVQVPRNARGINGP